MAANRELAMSFAEEVAKSDWCSPFVDLAEAYIESEKEKAGMAADLTAIQKIHDEQKTMLREEIRQLRAGIKEMERGADQWKRMYEIAQNANSFRQDALEKVGL